MGGVCTCPWCMHARVHICVYARTYVCIVQNREGGCMAGRLAVGWIHPSAQPPAAQPYSRLHGSAQCTHTYVYKRICAHAHACTMHTPPIYGRGGDAQCPPGNVSAGKYVARAGARGRSRGPRKPASGRRHGPQRGLPLWPPAQTCRRRTSPPERLEGKLPLARLGMRSFVAVRGSYLYS